VDVAGCSTVLPTLSEGFEIELHHFGVVNAMLKGDYLWQLVEIVIGGIPTILQVHFMWLFKCLGTVL